MTRRRRYSLNGPTRPSPVSRSGCAPTSRCIRTRLKRGCGGSASDSRPACAEPTSHCSIRSPRFFADALAVAGTRRRIRYGAIVFDFITGLALDRLPYELVFGITEGHQEADEYARGYYWANLLTTRHLDKLGGLDAFTSRCAEHSVTVAVIEQERAEAADIAVLVRDMGALSAFSDVRLAAMRGSARPGAPASRLPLVRRVATARLHGARNRVPARSTRHHRALVRGRRAAAVRGPRIGPSRTRDSRPSSQIAVIVRRSFGSPALSSDARLRA